jgi:plastocyanin
MTRLRGVSTGCCSLAMAMFLGCSPNAKKAAPVAEQQPAIPLFHVDPATAGSISGTIRFTGQRPVLKPIDMSNEPACVEAHKGKAYDESLVASRAGKLANAFIYVKSGLEGKRFDTPATPVVIDQKGCWFHPRVLGIQVGQTLEVANDDPVTHNIHPMAEVNREWNHSQGAGDPPINRRFLHPELMIPVKCNIHSWMHAWIGVVDNPYFAVSKEDGTYTIANLPPGTYTIAVWQEVLGTQERQVTIAPHADETENFTFERK